MRESGERYKLAMDDPNLCRAYEPYEETRPEYNTIPHENQKEMRCQAVEEARELRRIGSEEASED